jgi:hypothetical protein
VNLLPICSMTSSFPVCCLVEVRCEISLTSTTTSSVEKLSVRTRGTLPHGLAVVAYAAQVGARAMARSRRQHHMAATRDGGSATAAGARDSCWLAGRERA